jgi:uncharacterized protein (DUF433 family)
VNSTQAVYILNSETILNARPYEAGSATMNIAIEGPLLFTFPQASLILGMDQKAVRNAVERDLKPVGLASTGAGKLLSRVALLAIQLVHSYSTKFSAGFRRTLLKQIVKNSQLRSVQEGSVVVDLKEHREVVDTGVVRLKAAIAAVHCDAKVLRGEPCIAGTRIPVHMISEISVKYGIDETLDTYPNLTRSQVELAMVFAKAHPRQGRPKRTQVPSVKTKAARKRTATPNA